MFPWLLSPRFPIEPHLWAIAESYDFVLVFAVSPANLVRLGRVVCVCVCVFVCVCVCVQGEAHPSQARRIRMRKLESRSHPFAQGEHPTGGRQSEQTFVRIRSVTYNVSPQP